ncbi:MAG: hypothetical protein FJ290_19770 [Planctomycetes bacterium]|nr:hypothetical protein [Planctomycetota bacterium]
MKCPRCSNGLLKGVIGNAAMFPCPERHGLLIPRKTVASIIERGWAAVPRQTAESRVFRPRAAPRASIGCPQCHLAMETYPFCGIRAIEIDRCLRCDRLWLDANELEDAVVAVAKAKYRLLDYDALKDKLRLPPLEGEHFFFRILRSYSYLCETDPALAEAAMGLYLVVRYFAPSLFA